METSYTFLNSILDSVFERIAVIDKSDEIQYANLKWKKFGIDNKCNNVEHELESNYLNV